MNRIITTGKAIKISRKLRRMGKQIVLAGGVFDILHIGHIKFLEAAKKRGDVLFILLESDENVKSYKGEDRPINSQANRALLLSALKPIDYVVCLKEMKDNSDYDSLVINLKPDVIATTKKSPQEIHNKRQAKLINAEAASVISRISDKSTTKLADIIAKENKL
ncbi:MAG: adenylyltransferase/cytidyltransferase family protein [Patescibacteria group bacterium]|nr:adenylyltransferase/cytidyltransferase family protein [Patescibacteria group bacterium]